MCEKENRSYGSDVTEEKIINNVIALFTLK